NQVALIVVKNLADPGSGWVDAYAKAYVLLQLPHGLLAVSIATTFVPDLASAARRGAREFVDIAAKGLRLTALVTFPAAVGMFVLAEPLVGVIFAHGNFDSAAAETTAGVVRAMSLGLGGFSVYLFVLRCFYAHNDTRTPFIINAVENALNVVLAVVLVKQYDVAGLGLAFAIAYGISAIAAIAVLDAKYDVKLTTIARDVVTMAAGSTAMGVVVWLATASVGSNLGSGAALKVGLGVVVGVGAYGMFAATSVREVRDYLSSRTTRSSR
ncbi:MAG: lipid II flippase MurJ, partial [Actinomycetota bacterium]